MNAGSCSQNGALLLPASLVNRKRATSMKTTHGIFVSKHTGQPPPPRRLHADHRNQLARRVDELCQFPLTARQQCCQQRLITYPRAARSSGVELDLAHAIQSSAQA